MNTQRAFVIMNGILLTSLVAFGACSRDIEPPTVESASPDHQSHVNADDPVIVNFSEPMNEEKTESAFSLTSSEGIVAGSFRWENDDTRLVFIPELPLQNGLYYTIRVSTAAQDREGNTLPTEYIASFFVGTDMELPHIESIDPANGTSSFPLDGIITIRFSEAMDRMSVERGIQFTPSIDGFFQWVNDTTVEYRPFSPLTFNTDYQITVSTDCTDLSGNRLLSITESFFTAGNEFERPVISVITDLSSGTNLAEFGNFHEYTGIEHTTSFQFQFSEPVKRASLRDALAISPNVDLYLVWNDTSDICTVNFPNGLVPLQRYELRVNTGLQDAPGNGMAETFVVYFTVDGNDSLPPVISEVRALNAGGGTLAYLTDDTVGAGDNDLGTEFSGNLTCRFTIRFDREVDRVSVHDSSFVSFVSGEQPDVGGYVLTCEWDAANPYSVLTLTLGSIEGGNLYLFELKGGENGIKGRNGVPMNATRRYLFSYDAQD